MPYNDGDSYPAHSPFQLIFDNWTPLSYKSVFQSGRGPTPQPRWVGAHTRRLEAYKLLLAYRDNASRFYLETQDIVKRAQRRELGDANLIVETIVDAVLGDDVNVAVDGAGDKETPDPTADKIQEWFDEWDLLERPLLSIIEAEEDAVCMGDGIYVAAWDSNSERPTLTCYDPGFYFPVFEPGGDSRAFPETVHLAWEYYVDDNTGSAGAKELFVRRITYRLETVDPYSLPWNTEPATKTCLLTDASWKLQAVRNINDLAPDSAIYAVNHDGLTVKDLDLGIDFIPLVHLPNTIARKEHYGRSSLSRVLQLLDELQSADTDLALSARITGFPPIATKGAIVTAEDNKTILTYGPGTVFQGEVTTVDTSNSLDALLKYVEHVLRRISTNTRLPESVLGQNTGSTGTGTGGGQKFSSGYERQLSFAPMQAMVRKMRLSREEKYPLLFKFISRLAMQGGLIDANTEMPRIDLRFGSFLPGDRGGAITEIIDLFKAKLISRLQAMKMLVDLGLEIVEAEEEVTAIEHEDFDGAKILSDATGSETLAAEYLDLKIPKPDPNTLPPLIPPGQPGGPPLAPGLPGAKPPPPGGKPPAAVPKK